MTAISLGIFKHNASFKAVDYNMKKVNAGQAELLISVNFDALASIAKPAASDFKNYLLALTRSNPDLRQRQFHVAIGTKEKNISTKSLAQIAERWLWEMGYKEQPYLIFGHNDTPHAHVHIVSSRITSRGRLIPTHFDVRRGREAMSRILGIDEQAATEKAFQHAMSYKFKNMKQLTVLLGVLGYTAAQKQQELNIYYQNTLRLQVPNRKVLQRTSSYTLDHLRLAEIRELFNSNKSSISPALHELNRYVGRRVASKFTGWHSAMVELLERRLDIKIIFENKSGQLPYDYLIIDHKNKHIYDGKALMPLEEFTKERSYLDRTNQHSTSQYLNNPILSSPNSKAQQTIRQVENSDKHLDLKP